jgi:hypothetical protein
LTAARIIFVPGLKAKPPPEIYAAQLRRVLLAALGRSRPAAARALAAAPEAFVLVDWTRLLYDRERDVALDTPGIERLIAHTEPTLEERRIVGSWSRRTLRFLHTIGDAVPLLGRWFAEPALRAQIHDANRYLRNRDGIGVAIRARVRGALEAASEQGARVLLIGHSLGSAIAYDTLWELARALPPRRVDLFVTMGSPLGTRFIRRRLQGASLEGVAAYPTNVRRWVNLTAQGDLTALYPRLEPLFRPMLELGVLESFEDHVDLENFFRSDLGLNAHEAYGYFAARETAEVIGDWLQQSR